MTPEAEGHVRKVCALCCASDTTGGVLTPTHS